MEFINTNVSDQTMITETLINDILTSFNKTLYSESSISDLINRITNTDIFKFHNQDDHTEEDMLRMVTEEPNCLNQMTTPTDSVILTAIAGNPKVVFDLNLFEFNINLLQKIKLIVI